MDKDIPNLSRIVQTCQIVKLALAAGVASFGVVAIAMGKEPQRDDNMLFVWINVGFAVVLVVARAVVPSLVISRARSAIVRGNWKLLALTIIAKPSSEEEKLAFVYQNQMLVGSALLEGAAFGNLAAYFVQGHPISFITSVVLLGGLLIDFPTVKSVRNWIVRQKRTMDEERMLAGSFGEKTSRI